MIRLTAPVCVALALLAACNETSSPTPAASASATSTVAAATGAPAPAATETTPVAQASPSAPPPVIVGGYGPADLGDPDVKAALAVATAELYRKFPQRGRVETTTAQVQVVAGLNYAFDIKMTGGKSYKAVVYKDLKGKMSVTSLEASP